MVRALRGRTHDWQKQSWPQYREADNGRWSGDDVMTFGNEVDRIGSLYRLLNSVSLKKTFLL